MSDFDDELGGFEDYFGDFFGGGLRPGHKVALGGRLRYREGSDPRDWTDPGGVKYLPGDWEMQCGCVRWTGSAASSGGVEVTFPAPFGHKPLVFAMACATMPAFYTVRLQASCSSNEAVEIYWSVAPMTITHVDIAWLALGPIGLKA